MVVLGKIRPKFPNNSSRHMQVLRWTKVKLQQPRIPLIHKCYHGNTLAIWLSGNHKLIGDYENQFGTDDLGVLL